MADTPMRKGPLCPQCKGAGGFLRHDGLTATCALCDGSGVVRSGVTAAPRSEGPRKLMFDDVDGCTVLVEEVPAGISNAGKVFFIGHAMGFILDADAERQLYELLRLRAEQGPPVETKP